MKEKNNQNNLSCIWDNMWNWDIYNNQELRKFKNLDKLNTIKKMGFKIFPGEKIFDGGCGDGQTLITFLKEFKCVGFGIDISAEALKKASSNLKNENISATLSLGDVRKLPYNDCYFNAGLSFGVIEHFLDFRDALKEIYRVLKPGGSAIFVQPHKYSFGPLYRIIRQKQGRWNCGFQFEFSGHGLGKELKKVGFSKYKFLVKGPYKDMPYIYPFDSFFRIFSKKWGHYLFLIAEK